MHRVLFLLALVGLLPSCQTATSHIMRPIRGAGDEVGLIFVPGASINGMEYQKTALAIQQASKLRLWVALTGNYTLNTPNPVELPFAVSGAIQQLKKAGMKGNNFTGIAHSLGGVFLSQYAAGSTSLKSIILLGSYISRGTKLRDYPIPVMTLSGELDGQTRITRIAVDYEQLQQDIRNDIKSVYRTPVINIKGSNHAEFASGPMPSHVKNYDIEADITEAEAHEQIGKHCNNFLTTTFGTANSDVDKAKHGLVDAYHESGTRFKPLLEVKALDTNGSFSPWGIAAQSLFAGNFLDRTNITNKILNSAGFIMSKPDLIKIGQKIRVDTWSFVEYQMNPMDISTTPEGPWEIDVKMKSSDAIAQALQGGDETPTCKDINKAAFFVALQNSTSYARDRYVQRGRPLSFDDDVVYGTGIQWITDGFNMNETDEGLRVQSIALFTSTKSPVVPGMHYCKVLSPYRAMEWINVDSLRKKKP